MYYGELFASPDVNGRGVSSAQSQSQDASAARCATDVFERLQMLRNSHQQQRNLRFVILYEIQIYPIL